ncbi:DUF485 domain-containing protein, partial [Klebsiella pneumoniae]
MTKVGHYVRSLVMDQSQVEQILRNPKFQKMV